ncbi:MAG: hypothetical protein O3A93_13030 [Chloroflexi bacterium]|nr:hypothetical protein [Chloroflexota bacterium]MDA1272159.1 hypothetical protein [Chloroflexota bacterium]
MPYINIVLKNGTLIPVDDADDVAWVNEWSYDGATGTHRIIRVVCKRGEDVRAKFNADDVSGYTWHNGNRLR